MRTLADRIQWICDHSDDHPLNLAEIARRSDLKRQTVSQLVRKSKENPTKPIGYGETLTKIARGTNVDLDWLMTGRGAPRAGKLTARDVVLQERVWSAPARAAAMAEKRERSAEAWRALLETIEAAFAGEAAPPATRRKR